MSFFFNAFSVSILTFSVGRQCPWFMGVYLNSHYVSLQLSFVFQDNKLFISLMFHHLPSNSSITTTYSHNEWRHESQKKGLVPGKYPEPDFSKKILSQKCPRIFFQKSGSVTFVHLWCYNYMQKIRKTNERSLRYLKTDQQNNRRTDRLTGVIT